MADWTWLEDAEIPEDEEEHEFLHGKITELNQQINYVKETLETYRRRYASPEWQEQWAEYLEAQVSEAEDMVEVYCDVCGEEHPDERFCLGNLGGEWTPCPRDLARRARAGEDRRAQIEREPRMVISVNERKLHQLIENMRALGARQMRPYEHMNEEEAYYEALEARYENFNEDY